MKKASNREVVDALVNFHETDGYKKEVLRVIRQADFQYFADHPEKTYYDRRLHPYEAPPNFPTLEGVNYLTRVFRLAPKSLMGYSYLEGTEDLPEDPKDFLTPESLAILRSID